MKNTLIKSTKKVTSLFLTLAFLFSFSLMPAGLMAQEDEDSSDSKDWRKGHCFLKPSEDICRRKKSGDSCPGADYCDTLTYLKAGAEVAKLVVAVVK